MWEIPSLYGIPEKYIRTIKAIYENCSARIEYKGELIQKINISNEIRYELSAYIYLIVVDWIMLCSNWIIVLVYIGASSLI